MTKPKKKATKPRGRKKAKKSPALPKRDERRLRLEAGVAVGGTVQALQTMNSFDPKLLGQIEPEVFLAAVVDRVKAVKQGDLSSHEAMLVTQSLTLDTMFHSLAQRAQKNMGTFPEAFEMYMNLALKAQRQCRATIETLAEIKNPTPFMPVRVGQLNHAHTQQVNVAPAPAKNENPSNKLLEDRSHEWLDTRAPSTSGGAYQDVEAVGVFNGTED